MQLWPSLFHAAALVRDCNETALPIALTSAGDTLWLVSFWEMWSSPPTPPWWAPMCCLDEMLILRTRVRIWGDTDGLWTLLGCSGGWGWHAASEGQSTRKHSQNHRKAALGRSSGGQEQRGLCEQTPQKAVVSIACSILLVSYDPPKGGGQHSCYGNFKNVPKKGSN